MSDEKIFLNEGATYVSNTKIVLGATTYATANITSVSKSFTTPSTGCAIILMILGGLGVLISVSILLGKPSDGIVPFLGGAAILAIGILWFRSLKPDFHVVLSSASGEKRGLTSKDQAWIDRVVVAITDAITHRG
jgi:hypothetical protein